MLAVFVTEVVSSLVGPIAKVCSLTMTQCLVIVVFGVTTGAVFMYTLFPGNAGAVVTIVMLCVGLIVLGCLALANELQSQSTRGGSSS